MLAFAIAKGSEHAMTSFIGGMGQGASAAVSGALQQQTRDVVMGRTDITDTAKNYSIGSDARGKYYKGIQQNEYGQQSVEKAGDQITLANQSTGNTVTASQGATSVNAEASNLKANSLSAASTALSQAENTVSSVNKTLANGTSNTVQNATIDTKSGQVTTSGGKTIQIGETQASSLESAKSVATREATTTALQRDIKEAIARGEDVKGQIGAELFAQAGTNNPFFNAGVKVSKTDTGGIAYSLTDSSGQTRTFTVNNSPTTMQPLLKKCPNKQAKMKLYQVLFRLYILNQGNFRTVMLQLCKNNLPKRGAN
jgi:hypothetical protein